MMGCTMCRIVSPWHVVRKIYNIMGNIRFNSFKAPNSFFLFENHLLSVDYFLISRQIMLNLTGQLHGVANRWKDRQMN